MSRDALPFRVLNDTAIYRGKIEAFRSNSTSTEEFHDTFPAPTPPVADRPLRAAQCRAEALVTCGFT